MKSRSGRVAAIALVGVVSGVICFYGLGANDVHEVDEAWHEQAALELYQRGEWWYPTAFGSPFFMKPAPLLWLIAGSYHLLEPTPFTTRMWAALFAVGAVLATYLLGERVGGLRVGIVAGLALATGYTFVHTHCGRTGEFDSMMVFFFVLATWLFCRAEQTNRGWILCAAAVAMASHAKNFAGLLPALVLIVSLLVCRPTHRPNRKQWILSGLVFAVLNLAWIVPMTVTHGWAFLEEYIGGQVLERPFMPGARTTSAVFVKYSAILLSGFFPWAFLGMAGLVEDVRKAVGRRDAGSVVVLVWIVVLTVVLCWGLPRAKAWYVVPLLPFFAVSGSRFLVGSDERPAWAHWWRAVACVVLIAAAICFQLRPTPNPFALWSIGPPVLIWTESSRAGLLALIGLTAGAMAWFANRQAPPIYRQRYYVWPALAVLSVAGALTVVRPLTSVNYQNVYVRAREVLMEARGERTGSIVVNLPWNRFDILTRHYFSNIDGFRTAYRRDEQRAALAQAKTAPMPAFCVLISRQGPPPVPTTFPGRVIFSGEEPKPSGGTQLHVTVLEIEQTSD